MKLELGLAVMEEGEAGVEFMSGEVVKGSELKSQ